MAGNPNLSPDLRWSLAGMGVCFDPITATLGAISAFAAANAGALTAGSALLSLAGAGVTAAGTLSAGAAAKGAAYSQALQMEQQATQARASSQRGADERRTQTELAQSTLQARAAASGAGAQDATILGLVGGIAGRGEQQALTELYNGENTARGLEDGAAAKRVSGDAAVTGARYSAAGSMISGLGAGFGKFGPAPVAASGGQVGAG